MAFLYAVIMGLVQGFTEFLPISSSGHLAILQKVFGIQEYTGLPLTAFLHLGSMVAIILALWTDIWRLIKEVLGILLDLCHNFLIYTGSKQDGNRAAYQKIIHNNYRKLVVLLLVTALPTALLGFFARHLAMEAADSLSIVGIGFLITGLFLLVVDFIRPGYKIPRDMGFDCAMWIGICIGLSVFPGVSSFGLALSAGLLHGMKKSFAVKYAMLASVPALFGAFFVEIPHLGREQLTVGLFFCFFAGFLITAAVGFFVIRGLLRLVTNRKCRIFAYYCFVAGMAAFVLQFS